MLNAELKNFVVSRILPNVRTPAQYLGGELNSIVKDHGSVEGTVCLAFPDTYGLGMSHHGLQVKHHHTPTLATQADDEPGVHEGKQHLGLDNWLQD